TGGGIYAGEQSIVSLANSIVWGNTADDGHEIYADRYDHHNNGTVELEFTLYGNEANDVEGSGTVTLGAGLVTANPHFRDVDDENSPDYLRLAVSSSAIDAGSNDLYEAADGDDTNSSLGSDLDLADNPRVFDLDEGGIIDMGAYEYQPVAQTISALADIGKTYGVEPFDPGATASSGLRVHYVSSDNSIAEVFEDAE